MRYVLLLRSRLWWLSILLAVICGLLWGAVFWGRSLGVTECQRTPHVVPEVGTSVPPTLLDLPLAPVTPTVIPPLPLPNVLPPGGVGDSTDSVGSGTDLLSREIPPEILEFNEEAPPRRRRR